MVTAPREDRERFKAEQEAQKARDAAKRAAWEALSESEREGWIDRSLTELLATEKVSSVRQRMQAERGAHHRVKAAAQRLFNESRESYQSRGRA